MTPEMFAALSSGSAFLFGAVEIQLPNYTLRLLDGSGEVVINGNVFAGIDPKFGTISSVADLTDGTGDQAPALQITLLPGTDVAVAELASAAMQGSPVRVFFGAIDKATGLVIPSPEIPFWGELDVPTLNWDVGSRTLDYDIVSVFEKFFDLDEAARLSNAFHQSIWPGELGFEFVTGITQPIYWGLSTPAGAPAVAVVTTPSRNLSTAGRIA